MTTLLTAPAIAVILLQAQGIVGAIFSGLSVLVIQYFVSAPFIATDYEAYLLRAFDFGRQFLFKWTVNWRFVDEATFLSKGFAVSLLVVHVSLLVVFLQLRWTKPSASNPPDFFKRYMGISTSADRDLISKRITPTFVMDTMTASMVIGLLCARSLHYQFFAYLGWVSPYLLWRVGGSPSVVLVGWAVQEYAWLVYPSTNLSSALVVLSLALQVACALIAPPVDHIRPPPRNVGKVE